VKPSLLALLALGCAHASRSPTPSDQPYLIPPGCERSIAGTWMHESNASYQYVATDDGKVAHLLPRRVNADGTPMLEAQDSSMQMDVTLQRGAAGFTGDFRMFETMQSGEQCGVLFFAHVTSCSPDRLVMQLEQTYAVNSSCQRIDFGQSDLVEHVLVRVKQP
jgi:hypothetical protein